MPNVVIDPLDKRDWLTVIGGSGRSLTSALTDPYLLAEDFDGGLGGKLGRDADDDADVGLLPDFTTLHDGKGGMPSTRRRPVDEGGTPDDANRLDEIFTVTSKDWEMRFEPIVEMAPPFMDNPRNGSSPLRRPPLSHDRQSSGEQTKSSRSISTVTSFDTCVTHRASNKTPASSTGCKHARAIDGYRAIDPTGNDVLFGRGGHTNAHAGNVHFRRMALDLQPLYVASSREGKFNISKMLIEGVRNGGHRFLEKGSDGSWHEVTWKFARKKASQVLRERGRRTK